LIPGADGAAACGAAAFAARLGAGALRDDRPTPVMAARRTGLLLSARHRRYVRIVGSRATSPPWRPTKSATISSNSSPSARRSSISARSVGQWYDV
jgi:hypothetical protein